MDLPTKKQKVELEITSNNCKEEVLFNSDTLSKIISYLPSIDLLHLALCSKRFGESNTDDKGQSLIQESARIAVQDIAVEEQLAALPHYDGESSLADYHYLQLLREPLTFDQLVGGAKYVNDFDKSCVRHSELGNVWQTAFSSNIMRAGKHYATFETFCSNWLQRVIILAGVMRPGQANRYTHDAPVHKGFFQNFSRNRFGEGVSNNNVQCCVYSVHNGDCHSSDWKGGECTKESWEGMENMAGGRYWDGTERLTYGDELGLLLDLDEGTLSVYKNGQKLGVMKRGLAGPYCWSASMYKWMQVIIKRGTIPPLKCRRKDKVSFEEVTA